MRNYKEAVYFGLSLRQFICCLLVPITAVFLYFSMQEKLGTEVTGWLCILGAAPFAACGFFSYYGMTAEQVLWAIVKPAITTKHLVFRSQNLYYTLLFQRRNASENTRKSKTAKP